MGDGILILYIVRYHATRTLVGDRILVLYIVRYHQLYYAIMHHISRCE